MKRIAWWLLILFAFTIPWEYSLNLGEPLGNIARMVGILVLLAAIPAILQAGRLRTPGLMQWLVLAFYFWMCVTIFWSIDPAGTLEKMRGYFQEMMLVWLIWEFAEDPADLRWLLRAYVAGACVLAIHSMAGVRSAEAIAAGQIRFVAEGQDANDVARFLDLGIIFAALLLISECRRAWRLLAGGFLPLGLAAIVLTASRGGFLGALVALAGCCLLLSRNHPRIVLAGVLSLPLLASALWVLIPHGTIDRLATIPSQLQGGDLNQRMNIWHAGWRAFTRAPLLGTGAGTFTSAARTDFIDTAHNTALSIAVGAGLCGLFLAVAIAALAGWLALASRGPLRIVFGTALLLWAAISMVDTLEENRTTWLLLGLVALAERISREQSMLTEACFPEHPSSNQAAGASGGSRPPATLPGPQARAAL
jgi:exopolysaccharide production protein ExoQ